MSKTDDKYIQDVEKWLQEVVIGLNLCPFARHPYDHQQIHFSVSHAKNNETLMNELAEEGQALMDLPVIQRETTLLIVPERLSNFEEYLDFLALGEDLIEQMGWQGELQLASFHPDYQFSNTCPDDTENLTNRSPYPVFHLIREASIEKALKHYPNPPDSIFENNIQKVNALSEADKRRLFPYLFH